MNVMIKSSSDTSGVANTFAQIGVSTVSNFINIVGQYSIFPMPFYNLGSSSYMSSTDLSSVLNVNSTSTTYYIVFQTSTNVSSTYANLTTANLSYNYVKIA